MQNMMQDLRIPQLVDVYKRQIYKYPISYEFKEKNISDEVVQFYSGMLNEIFLCLWYQDVRIVIGAFRINNVTSTEFSHVYDLSLIHI